MDASIDFYNEATVNIHDVPQGDFVKWAHLTGAKKKELSTSEYLTFPIGNVSITLYSKTVEAPKEGE